jgi:hypothetical protein
MPYMRKIQIRLALPVLSVQLVLLAQQVPPVPLVLSVQLVLLVLLVLPVRLVLSVPLVLPALLVLPE